MVKELIEVGLLGEAEIDFILIKVDVCNLKFLQVLSFNCLCCFFVSRDAFPATTYIIFQHLLHFGSANHQCFADCNMQHSDLWDYHSLKAISWWQEIYSSSSDFVIISTALVLHVSLLYRCSIANCSSCHVSSSFEEEIHIQFIGKGDMESILFVSSW